MDRHYEPAPLCSRRLRSGSGHEQAAFKTGDVAVTSASHIGITLWQIDDAPRYRLAVARSYSGSFWRSLVAAAAEYGCEVSPEVTP